VKGGPWTEHTLKRILCNEAALGYLLYGGRPVLGADGRPVRLAEPLWDRATHDALMTATAPKRDGRRAPKGLRLLTGATFAGTAGRGCTSRGAATPGTYPFGPVIDQEACRASRDPRSGVAQGVEGVDAVVAGGAPGRNG
jgi:hypothetical protein